MLKVISPLLLVLFPVFLLAQSKASGKLVDENQSPLLSATVMLLQAEDSVLTSFAMTDNEGKFELGNIKAGEYVLKITYLGYLQYQQELSFEATNEVRQLGTIEMEPIPAELETVTVFGERNEVEVRGDTLSFNAQSFQTEPNADVESLLKKLPGLEVDRDGNIKAQGEDVQQVLVDGKEFFGKDPKTATKNLPAEAIDQVEVFDQLSDQSEFTGVDDGNRTKTINLKLKQDYKKGAFGRLSAGYGTEDRFESQASINKFNEKTQISFLGGWNNINQQGFSIQDYISFSGGLGNIGGGGRGIRLGGNNSIPISSGPSDGFTESLNAGLNFSHQFSKKTKFTASYIYSNIDKDIDQQTRRETFLEEGSFITEETSIRDDLSGSHRVNLRFDAALDSTQQLRLRANASFTDNETDLSSFSSSALEAMSPTNTSLRDNDYQGNNVNWNSNLTYSKKFARPGRSFTTTINYGYNDRLQDANLRSFNAFLTPPVRTDTIIQLNDQNNDGFNYGIEGSFIEPLGNRHYLQADYNYSKNATDISQEVFDVKDGTLVINDQLTQIYNYGYTYNRGGLTWRMNRRDYTLAIGSELQHSDLDGEVPESGQRIQQEFLNVLPFAQLDYKFTSTKNLNVRYRTNVNEPSLQQLQPIVDNSDPLNIYVGNPDLRPEYQHNIRTRFLSFNPGTYANFFGILNLSYTSNKIKNSQVINEDLVTITQPVNVDDDYRASTFFNFGQKITKLDLRCNTGINLTYNRGFNFINTVRNATDSYTTGFSLKLDNLNKDVIDWSGGLNISFTNTTYSVATDQNRSFLNQTYFADLGVNLPLNFRVTTSLDYDFYQGLDDGFNQEVPIWNASLSKFLTKDRRLELKVYGVDLLDRNRGVNRTADLNFILDEQIASLGRYFMLNVSYQLKGFNPDGNMMKGGRMYIRK